MSSHSITFLSFPFLIPSVPFFPFIPIPSSSLPQFSSIRHAIKEGGRRKILSRHVSRQEGMKGRGKQDKISGTHYSLASVPLHLSLTLNALPSTWPCSSLFVSLSSHVLPLCLSVTIYYCCFTLSLSLLSLFPSASLSSHLLPLSSFPLTICKYYSTLSSTLNPLSPHVPVSLLTLFRSLPSADHLPSLFHLILHRSFLTSIFSCLTCHLLQ